MDAYRAIGACLVVVLTLAMLGCSSKGSSSHKPDDHAAGRVMNALANLYGMYLDSHQGRPPKDEKEFRAYLDSMPQALAAYNVTQVDQMLTSPRDGQPFVIIFGKKKIAPADSPGTPWAAYEQTGIDGKRFAVQVRGGVKILSDTEIEQIASQVQD